MNSNTRDKLGSLAVYERKIPFEVSSCKKSIAKYFKDDTKIGFITKNNKEKGIEVMDGRCPEGFHQSNTSYELVYKDIHPCHYDEWKAMPVFSLGVIMAVSMAYLKRGLNEIVSPLFAGWALAFTLVIKL